MTSGLSRHSGLWPVLALIAVILAAYANSLGGDYVFDDQSTILENESIRRLWPLSRVLSPPADAGICGRPFANLTMALNYAAHGLEVRGYHAVNLLIHVLAALTLFGVVSRTLVLPTLRERFGRDAPALAFAIAALWGLHPVNTIAVDYISQRVEALMGLFYLLTLYAFIRAAETKSPRWIAATFAACALGMASKEVMVTAPVLIFLYDRTFFAGSFRSAWRTRWPLHLSLAGTWVLLGYLMLQAQLAHRGIGYALGVSPFDYALTSSRTIWIYLRLAVWPDPLIFDYGWAYVNGLREAGPYLIATLGLLAAIAFALWRAPRLGFLGAWFFVVLAPSTSLVPIIQQPIAESRLYVPLVTVPALLVLGLYRLHRRTRYVWISIGVLFAALTYARNEDYRTPLALWTDTVAKRPENARAHNNLGSALVDAGRISDALPHFDAAIRLQPAYAEPQNNQGAALVRAGRPQEALPYLDAALRARPDFPDALYNRGEALILLGRTEEAIDTLLTAARVRPNHAKTHNNLSVALLQSGRVSEAETHASAAVRLDPIFAEAHYNLANAIVHARRPRDAIAHYETALRLRPNFPQAHNNLGVALLQSGRPAAAADHFARALELQPDHRDARRNLEQARNAAAR